MYLIFVVSCKSKKYLCKLIKFLDGKKICFLCYTLLHGRGHVNAGA